MGLIIYKGVQYGRQTDITNKVDKEEGKGLSTNDYTNEEKEKLSGIEAGAQVNTITGIKGNSETLYRVGNVNITKANIGLSNVDNTSDANKPISNATQAALNNKVDITDGKGLSTEDYTTTEKNKLSSIEDGAQVNTITGVKGDSESNYRTGNVNITKGNIGLSNVDNTSDANKPISTATQAALNDKISTSLKGAASGVAELDENGKVPTSQLPSFVDDVVEYSSSSNFPMEGETGKIYIDTLDNKTYRWSGSGYVEISPSLALGETSATAYRGDRGKTAYDHAQAKGSAFSSGLYKITTNSEGHVTGATAVTKADITGLGIPGSDTTYSSKSASQNGTDVSLVTTGEKYTWNNKVDKVAGKGLSTEDYTTAEKEKLSNLSTIYPTDGVDFKTRFRIVHRGYTGSYTTFWYYPLVRFPANDGSNYASLLVDGRMGGYEARNMSFCQGLIWNRNGAGIALYNIPANSISENNFYGLCDFVIYKDTSTLEETVYVKCAHYFAFDFNLKLFQSSAEILYDGSYLAETPPGELTAQASTSTHRLSFVNGKLLLAGVVQPTRAEFEALPCLVVNCGTLSSLPTTINNAAITADMVVVAANVGNPSAQAVNDWQAVCVDGAVTISGTISGTTALTLYLMKSRT